MNLKKIFFLNIFTTLYIFSFSQNTISIDWITINEYGKQIETFDNAIYLQDYNGLPSFQIINKLKSSEYYDIDVFDIEYTSVSENERLKLKDLDMYFG